MKKMKNETNLVELEKQKDLERDHLELETHSKSKKGPTSIDGEKSPSTRLGTPNNHQEKNERC